VSINIQTAFILLIAPVLVCSLSGQPTDQGKESPITQSGSAAVDRARIYYDIVGMGVP
jgi:hypothetical protein